MDENALAAREQAVFAKVGRLVFVVEEQGQALQNSSNTIQLLEQFLEEKGLRDEFLEFAKRPKAEANGKPDKTATDNVKKQAKNK